MKKKIVYYLLQNQSFKSQFYLVHTEMCENTLFKLKDKKTNKRKNDT